jgi:hypothetical protein
MLPWFLFFCVCVCVGCTKVNFLETKNRHGAAGSTAPSTNEKYTRDPLLLDYLFQTPPTLSYESADPLFFTHKETFGHLRIPTFQLFYSPLYSNISARNYAHLFVQTFLISYFIKFIRRYIKN